MKLSRWVPAFSAVIALALGVLLIIKTPDPKSPTSFLPPSRLFEKLEPLKVTPKKETQSQLPSVVPDAPASSSRELEKSVLNQKTAGNQRFESLTELIAQGSVAVREIAAIAAAPMPHFSLKENPHSQDAIQDRFEKSLRITAIEALDTIGATGVDVRQELQQVRDSQKDAEIVFLASIALAGIAEGRPGKVTRFIDQV
ncbi:MAG: hypothetical protein H7326_10475, partial [Bdellovibrionaceae bacterium]|nr:hypothetical protein [Pseudobdellovibrionaceae bacterium]